MPSSKDLLCPKWRKIIVRLSLIFLSLFLIPRLLQAQGEANIWYIGPSNGIDFNSGSPVVKTGFIASPYDQGSASISDKYGHLLFYTNGVTVWNRNNVPMPNGENLNGEASWQILIIKKPGAAFKYYIFYFPYWHNSTTELYYSEVDMSLDGGLGDVTQAKNIMIQDSVEQKLTSAMNSNGKDIWVITHSLYGNTFYSFLVTDSGVSKHAITSQAGQMLNSPYGYKMGQMVTSPDGTKIAMNNPSDYSNPKYQYASSIELFSFNASNAQFSNSIYIYGFHQSDLGVMGLALSPNGRYLYASQEADDSCYVYQYDLCNFTSQSVINSQQIVGSQKTIVAPYVDYAFYQMQLAPDNKIYLIDFADSILHVIEQPDNPGLSCSFKLVGFNTENSFMGYTLPNFSNSIIRNITKGRFSVKNVCLGETTLFDYNERPDSIKWDFGDPSSGKLNYSDQLSTSHTYSMPGNYQVTAIVYTSCSPDTLSREVNILSPTTNLLGNDTTLCQGDILTLEPQVSNASFLWQDNSTGYEYRVTKAGKYWVTINKDGCTIKDTIAINYKTAPTVFIGDDTTLCKGGQLILNAGNDGATYLWDNHSSQQQRLVDTSGAYWVKVTQNGCSASDTITCNFTNGPAVNLGDDTSLCNRDSLMLYAKDTNASYLWQNNSEADSFLVTKPGSYYLKASENGCTIEDSIRVTYNPDPNIFLGNDTSLCEGNKLTLDAFNTNFTSYQWQDNTNSSTYNVQKGGTYWVKVLNKYGCSAQDSIKIGFTSLPRFSLGNDTSLCEGQNLNIKVNVPDASYLWTTGNTTGNIDITSDGSYWLMVSKGGCSYADTISVNFNSIPKLDLGDDTTLCGGEELLLNAYNSGATYQWQDGSTNATYEVKGAGSYSVIANKEGCEDSTSVNVAYQSAPSLDITSPQTICSGDSILLQPNLKNVTYLWQDGSTLPYYWVTQPGAYTIDVKNGCGQDFETINVTSGTCKIYIPSAFTPNNDGENDYFRVLGGNNISNFHLKVFNRWGEPVFESEDKTKGWDGTFKGVQEPTGAYVWELQYKDDQKNKIVNLSGTVLLIR